MLGVVTAVGAVGAVAFVFLIVVMASDGLQQAGAWASPLGALAGLVAAVAAVMVLVPRRPKVVSPAESEVVMPPEPEVPEWVVDRPDELAAVVSALVDADSEIVGITTQLYGAGGFGKTVLARMACADRRVWQWFGGRVHRVPVGRDVRGAAAIAAKVNDVIKLVTGQDASFADPQLAGQHLGSVLDAGPRRLLVLDDVWEPEQLTPFTQGGRHCARLVTTRVSGLLAGRGPAVLVDQMSDAQARALLTAGLPPLEEAVVTGLLAVTGRWPLLLRLVNKILATYARMAGELDVQGAALVKRLTEGGPAVVDEVLREDGRTLDVGDPGQREQAVRATIEASTGLLSGDDAERFAELSVFAEDEAIPFGLVVRLWQATAGLDNLRAAQVVSRLTQLAVVSQAPGPGGGVVLHDVIRDFLRAGLGQPRLAGLHAVLLDAVATDLPAAGPLDGAAGCAEPVAWWQLGEQDRYLWDHLIEHLARAERTGQAEAAACDLRWVGARLERFGPAAPAADLAVAGTPRAARLRAVLVRTAHLLAPTEPAGALVDVLHSRVAEDPDWGPQVVALNELCRRPRLVSRWPLPDLAGPALRRALSGNVEEVYAVVVAPDGSWLASGSDDGTVRIWDVATGQEGAVLEGHTDMVRALAVAPDASWLASGSDDGTVRIWDVATGQERAVLESHTSHVEALAVAPDGSWLASGSWDSTVRIWDAATSRERALLPGHTNVVRALAVAPDGSWLASGSDDGTVRIWDVATSQERALLPGHTDMVRALAVAPDGSWLASGGFDGTVRIWDTATSQERAVLESHTSHVEALAVAPDGSWLATSGWDGTVRIWDTASRQEQAILSGHTRGAVAVAVAPDGSWLAAGGGDGTIRIWDMAADHEQVTLSRHRRSVLVLAAAPDGSWLATGSGDRTIRIWDTATGQERSVLADHAARVEAVAVAPDGSWLASGGNDATVWIWDLATGQEHAVLRPASEPAFPRPTRDLVALAVAPDGSWLASGGEDGTVWIWDVATSQERLGLSGHTDWVKAVAVAPDGSWLASGSWDNTVRIWDVATGQERAVLTGHAGAVEAVAVAPDGSWLATGGWDKTVRIWDVATGQERAVLSGHTDWVKAVAVTPDGSWLASCGWDGVVRIWHTVTGQPQAMMRVDSDITTCAWLGSDALVLGGSAGLYLFDFFVETGGQAIHGPP